MESNGLHVEGWALALNGGAVDGFRAISGGRSIDPVMVPVDAQDGVTPTGAFSLLVPLDAQELAGAGNRLLSIIPLVGGREGYRLTAVPQPTLPLPDIDDLSRIFGTPASDRTRTLFHAAWPVGFEYLGYFIDLAGLAPSERVLEVGCGPGRMAYALSYYLAAEGRYAGFDPMAGSIEWAQKAIASRAPNFRFRHVDARNPAYATSGTKDASSFVFPEADGAFDFVFLVSVFTHLLAPAVRQYLSEIRRVLRPGGRCLCSWYLLNDESQALLDSGKSNEAFPYVIDGGLAQDKVVPETLVAFGESLVREWLRESGLTIERVIPGRWCGRAKHLSYQDIIVVTA